MSPSRAVATAFLLLATTLALVACDEDGDTPAAEKPPEVDPSSNTSPSAESTEGTETEGTESAEPEAIPTAYPEVGLQLVDFPALTRKNRAALEVYVRFQRGRLQLLRQAAMNDLVLDTSAPPVLALWQDVADSLKANNTRFRGKSVATFTEVAIKGRLVVIDVCLDGSALRLIVNGEPGSFDGPTRAPFRTVVTRTDTGLAVTESRTLPGTC